MEDINDKGLIGYYRLEEWFSSLTEDEKQKMRDYYSAPGGLILTISYNPLISKDGDMNSTPSTGRDPSELEIGNPSIPQNDAGPQTCAGFLQSIGTFAVHNKDYDFAEKILQKALDSKDVTLSDRHFIYNELITLYYKQRDAKPDAIDKCIRYCKEDISFLEEFLIADRKEHEDRQNSLKEINDELINKINGNYYPPRIPSLARLIIIYENQGKISEAIEICEIGIKYGLKDGTKGGFVERRIRLEKKL